MTDNFVLPYIYPFRYRICELVLIQMFKCLFSCLLSRKVSEACMKHFLKEWEKHDDWEAEVQGLQPGTLYKIRLYVKVTVANPPRHPRKDQALM